MDLFKEIIMWFCLLNMYSFDVNIYKKILLEVKISVGLSTLICINFRTLKPLK